MFYAKSKPPQTIYEHTEKLRQLLEQLRNSYSNKMIRMDDNMWRLLRISVDYHDVGKADSYFQYRIQSQLKDELDLKPIKPVHNEIVPHNYLSVGLIPFKELNVDKKDVSLLAQVVGYHHEREQSPMMESIREILEQDIRLKLEKMALHTGLVFPERHFYYGIVNGLKKRLWPPFKGTDPDKLREDPFWSYILLKGLLHRLDHTASDPSPEIVIENDVDKHIGDYITQYFNKKNYTQNKLQFFAENHQDKNVIVIAQTGMGKTEAALYWIGDDKAYFTLPLRVSANSIYDRISDSKEGMGYSAVGLLHSTSADYLATREENWEQIINQSRHLANKLTITTIDQILKFPFFYRGFEKELATLSYSKVVIDEIQAYDPKIVAMLIKALEMLHLMGGRFMIMTATMPPIYLDKLRQRGHIPQCTISEGQFLDDSNLRHRLELQEIPITEAVDEIVAKGQHSQILVIVNTVNKAIELYELLIETVPSGVPLHLLHGRFVGVHRQQLEARLRIFNEKKPKTPGIWVTTQIVEASLDIDFDWLFTELSTLDSLFQRLGRCYRRRLLIGKEANIKVFTQELSGVPSVYDEYLVQEGLTLLRPYHNELLTETVKVRLVNELYSGQRLKGSSFLRELEDALIWFDELEPYNLSKQEAQNKMRNIQQDRLLPNILWDEVSPLIEAFKQAVNFQERYNLKRQIEQFTVSIRQAQRRKLTRDVLPVKGLEHIYYDDVEYDFCPDSCMGKGLVLGKSESSNRFI